MIVCTLHRYRFRNRYDNIFSYICMYRLCSRDGKCGSQGRSLIRTFTSCAPSSANWTCIARMIFVSWKWFYSQESKAKISHPKKGARAESQINTLTFGSSAWRASLRWEVKDGFHSDNRNLNVVTRSFCRHILSCINGKTWFSQVLEKTGHMRGRMDGCAGCARTTLYQGDGWAAGGRRPPQINTPPHLPAPRPKFSLHSHLATRAGCSVCFRLPLKECALRNRSKTPTKDEIRRLIFRYEEITLIVPLLGEGKGIEHPGQEDILTETMTGFPDNKET